MLTLRQGLKPLLCLALLAVGTVSRTTTPGEGSSLRELARAESRRAPSPLLPRSAFLARSNLVDVKLSPRGRHVAFLRRNPADQSLWLLDTAGGEPRLLLRHSEATRLHWSADGAWLFLESPRQLFALSVKSAPGSGVMTLFGGRQGRRMLAADPVAPDAALVIEEVRAPGAFRPSAWRLLRLRPAHAPQIVLQSRREIAGYVPDAGGGFVKLADGDHFTILRVEANGRMRELLRCVRLEQCTPLSSLASGELLLSADVGGNLERLVRLDRAGRLSLVHQDPAGQSDLADVAIDPVGGRPLVAHYRSVSSAAYPLRDEMRPHLDGIRGALGGHDFRLYVGRGAGARWLVAELDDRLQHPRWHLYDPATRRLREILTDVEQGARRVPAEAAARRIPFSYRASDGFLLHGFVSIPAGENPARVPLVVQVHGGPWSHVAAGYSSLTQFLVNRGYAVFEPNFRGSTGYGRAYAFAGDGDFGNGRVQQDVVEGTRFLIAQGIGDPGRVGITGVSFGGYSALVGVTFAPDLFRVAVAAMPPTDFGWAISWQTARERARGFSGRSLEASLLAMSLDPANRNVVARLHTQSPMANISLLRRPVLLVAGGRDESVPLRSVVDYAARLKAAGCDVSLFVDPDSGHGMGAPGTQEQYLFLMERMLGAHLGGRIGAPPAGDIRRKLQRNLRLAGGTFTDTPSGGGRIQAGRTFRRAADAARTTGG